jgi:hypothetical protein
VKYFTAPLLALCRSSDPDLAEAAAVKWQQRCAAYRKRFAVIHDQLPRGVRRLVRSTTLHDARLLTVNVAELRGEPNLLLSFQLALGNGQEGVQLRYAGFEQFSVLLHEPGAAADTELFALYDEFDLTANGTATHAILMTAGVEIRVRFKRLFVMGLTRVVAPGRGQADIREQLQALQAS